MQATPLKVNVSAAIQMQAQLSNLIAIQNLQEYLKYLILTTSVEPQQAKPTEKAAEGVTEQATPVKQEFINTMEEENTSQGMKSPSTPATNTSFSSSYMSGAMKRKKSQKLFSLMQKKYTASAAKDKKNDETAERHETLQEKINSIPLFKKNSKPKELVCGHPWREHYAKGLCGSCYLRYGRTKKPWNCSHDKLYALGLCQKCYAAKYNMKKKAVDSTACHQIKDELFSTANCQNISNQMVVEQSKPVEDLRVKIETN